MKKLALMLIASVCTMSLALFADTQTVNGVTWTYTIADGKATVGMGAQGRAIPSATTGALVVPSTLGGCPVVRIETLAFWCCYGLTSISIPATVTSIGSSAFQHTSGVTSYEVSSGNPSYCSVGGVLYTRDKSTLISFPDNRTGDFTVPSDVVSIGSQAFEDCGLQSVTIPSTVKSIDLQAFINCEGLTSVALSEGVTNIGSCAFYGCKNLQSLTLPASVKLLGYNAFYDCETRLFFLGQPPYPAPSQIGGTCVGYFPAECADEWTLQIVNGYWCDVEMHCTDEYTVHFDANDGEGEMDDVVVPRGYKFVLPTSEFIREGYSFGGWTYSANSTLADLEDGQRTSGSLTSFDEVTLYAFWRGNTISVTFDRGPFSDTTEPTTVQYVVGTAFHDFPVHTRTGWRVKGWFTQPSGGVRYQAGDILPFTEDGTLYLQAEYVGEDDQEPGPGPAPRPVPEDESEPAPDWTPVTQPDTIIGYFRVLDETGEKFVETEGSLLAAFSAGGECRGVARVIDGPNCKLFPITIGIAGKTEAGLKLKCWDAATETTYDVADYLIDVAMVGDQAGNVIAPLVVAVGNVSDDPAANKNAPIADPQLKGDDLKPVETPAAALTYSGYVTNGEEIVGLVTVKVTTKGAVTATVQLPEGTKLAKTSYKGTLGKGGKAELVCSKNSGEMSVLVCEGLVSGTIKVGKEKLGFTARSGAKDVLAGLDGFSGKVWTVALKTAPAKGLPELMNGYSVLSVAGGKKGKMKVGGVLADGTKVSVTAQGMAFGDSVVVPVVYRKKTTAFSLKLILKEKGGVQVGNVSAWTSGSEEAAWEKAIASESGNVKPGAKFGLDEADIPKSFDVVDAAKGRKSILPNGVPVKQVDASSGKWTLPKAGKVAFVKGTTDLDESKFTAKGETDPNPAALKLTFKKKTGLFSGSFQFYQLNGDKLKKLKATVNGAVVDGKGYGSATVKNMGALPVTVGANCGECQP